ncbi:hypothetical protein LTR29_017687 [Friedmanniomyces endolithicus]|nr:hypothetical protein LTR29_017687 [Friedmanniomyces endolithicus]
MPSVRIFAPTIGILQQGSVVRFSRSFTAIQISPNRLARWFIRIPPTCQSKGSLCTEMVFAAILSSQMVYCVDTYVGPVKKRGGHATQKLVHTANKLWSTDIACQTFFRQQGWLRYFQVTITTPTDEARERDDGESNDTRSTFFASQHEDISLPRQDAIAAANVVEGFDEHQSTVVPWLQTTGIADRVKGLRKDQVRSATAVPQADKQPVLRLVVDSMQNVLETAHSWCSDGPDCMLTWPCRIALHRFHGLSDDATGKTKAFAPIKQPRSLKNYFTLALRFLSYLYRTTQPDCHHFDVEDESQARRPERIIRLTKGQQRAWELVIQTVGQRQTDHDSESSDDGEWSDDLGRDEGSSHIPLEDQLLNLWMLLITHDTAA